MVSIRKAFYSCICLFSLMSATSLMAKSNSPFGGVVHLRGAVTNGTCVVNTESENKQVYMGRVRSSQLTALGSWSDPISFTLNLFDCALLADQQIGIVFNGVSDGKDPLVFSAGEGPNAAQGVGIGIFDVDGNLIVPNSRPHPLHLFAGDIKKIPFTARYRATSRNIVAGDASSSVFFTLYYP